MRDITGRVLWRDENDAHGLRPGSCGITLLADGAALERSAEWSDTDTDVWAFAFREMPVVRADGTSIDYTVQAQAIDGYETSIDGLTVTHALVKRKPEATIGISGGVTWVDGDEAAKLRPGSVTVELLRDGAAFRELTVTSATDWRYTFADLPADDGYGHAYAFAVRARGVEGYIARSVGYDVVCLPLSAADGGEDSLASRLNGLTEDELEALLALPDRELPLLGRLLDTGDPTPIRPLAFAALGALAVAALLATFRRRRTR